VFLGASCNDGDPNTSGDVIVEDCSCQGVVGIEDVDSVNGGIVLYPNPVSDQLFVKFGLTESNQISFDIYDVAGRLVSSEVTSLVIEENLYSIDTKDMNQGLYFLKVSSDEDETTKRFSVVR